MENNNEFLAMKQRARDSKRYESIEHAVQRLESKIDQLMDMLKPEPEPEAEIEVAPSPAKKATK